MRAWPPLAGRPRKRGSRLFLNWVFTSRERPKIASAPIWAASDADPRCAFSKDVIMDLLALAKTIADRVEVAASRVVPVAVSIIDTHGNMILQHRMSGAPAFSLEISERKAYTSALVGMRTADLLPLVQPGQDLFPLMGLAGGRYCAMGGGAPLSRGGERGAGVGVSGGTVEQDVAILEAGGPKAAWETGRGLQGGEIWGGGGWKG